MALNFIRQQSFKTQAGMRPRARKIGVLITDGKSQDDVEAPSKKLKDEGVELFAIGKCWKEKPPCPRGYHCAEDIFVVKNIFWSIEEQTHTFSPITWFIKMMRQEVNLFSSFLQVMGWKLHGFLGESDGSRGQINVLLIGFRKIPLWFSTEPCLFLISIILLSRKNTEETLLGGDLVLEIFRRN